MFAHIVPQVYQKAWHTSLGKKNVFYFNKDNIDRPISIQGGNIKNHLGIEDEYIISSIDNTNGLNNEESAIENYFANDMENKWDLLIKSDIFRWMQNIVKDKDGIIGIQAEDLVGTPFETDLLDYIILQNLRIYENFIELDNGKMNLILECIYQFLDKRGKSPSRMEFEQLLSDEQYKRSIWKSIIIDCKDKNKSFLSLVRNGLLENCNLTFIYIKKEIKERFILSDNPVIWNSGEDRKYKELENGVFFPISPNCMVAYLNYGREDIKNGDALCVFPCGGFIKYMNNILLSQSFDQIGFMTMDVKDNISNKFDKQNDWDIMF